MLGGVDEVQDQARHLAVGVLEAAGVRGRRHLGMAGRRHPHLEMRRAHGPHHHLGELRGHVGPVLEADPFGDRVPDVGVAMQAQKLEETAVAVGDPALEVEEHDPHRRLVEQPAQPPGHEGVRIVARQELAEHDGSGVIEASARVAVLRLHQEGGETRAALAPKAHGAVRVRNPGLAFARLAGDDEIAERTAPDLGAFQVQPLGERLVGVDHAPVGVGREEPDRQAVQKIGQMLLLAAADRVELVARSHVLDPPKHEPGTARPRGHRHRRNRDAAPLHRAVPRHHRDFGLRRNAGLGGLADAGELGRGLLAKGVEQRQPAGDRIDAQDLALGRPQKLAECRVDVDEGAALGDRAALGVAVVGGGDDGGDRRTFTRTYGGPSGATERRGRERAE